MPKISDKEIASHARAAGFSVDKMVEVSSIFGITQSEASELVVSVAIAIAESGGKTHAHNTLGPDNSYGLWQVNMKGGLGPYRRKKYNLATNDELFEPTTNARVAYGIYTTEGDRGFRHWSVYTSGAFATYLSRANKAVTALGEDTGTSLPIDDIDREIQSITDLVKFIADPENWKRVALFIGGAIALGVGMWMLFVSQANPAKIVKRVING